MITVNHGKWVKYVPDPTTVSELAPPNTLYCKRESDGLDWYAFSHAPSAIPKIGNGSIPTPPTDIPEPGPTPVPQQQQPQSRIHPTRLFRPSPAIQPKSVGCVASLNAEGVYIIGPATYDVSALFPANGYFVEVQEYTGSDPQKDIGGMVYDPTTGSLTPPAPIVRIVQRSTIVERLHELNKMTELSTFINNHLYQKERWYANQHFKVNDNVLLAMLTEIGADPGVVLKP